jgi:hypothetical protein
LHQKRRHGKTLNRYILSDSLLRGRLNPNSSALLKVATDRERKGMSTQSGKFSLSNRAKGGIEECKRQDVSSGEF